MEQLNLNGPSPELFNSGYDEYFKNIYSGYYEYFKNINSGYYEWLSGARDSWVVQRVHYYVSGAREYVSSAENALLREWCMRVVYEGSAREYVAVHE